jgi:5'-AMP-activated protein kinase catalytic alpha subunit
MTADGSVKLSDFGLGALPASVNSESGKLMTTCGTPNYVAPEVLMKSGYDGAPADIWSLGAHASHG